MSHTFQHPILGQEAIVPDYGLGRVTGFTDDFPFQWIEVRTYADNAKHQYAPKNVILVPIVGLPT